MPSPSHPACGAIDKVLQASFETKNASQSGTKLPYSAETEFAIAMSGGGHRASLYGLGGLMAIVDSGANKRVRQISSVSGGSITNLVVAHACSFSAAQTDGVLFDGIARKLFDETVRGVLTRFSLLSLAGLIIGPVGVFVYAAVKGLLPGPSITLPAIMLWALLILFRGLPLELLFRTHYFRGTSGPLQLNSLGKAAEEANGVSTEHIACCTDLVLGSPVYFSTWDGGRIIHSRRGDGATEFWYDSAGGLPVAAIMRASAGFPGIPPRRFQSSSTKWTSRLSWFPWRFDKVVFLSDGGIWNNLGTQALIEQQIWRGLPVFETPKQPLPVICLDASAPVGEVGAWDFHIPGWAEIKALAREAIISNGNTVAPRIKSFDEAFSKSICSIERQDSGSINSVDTTPYLIGRDTYADSINTFVASLGNLPSQLIWRIHSYLYERWVKGGQDVTELEADSDHWSRVFASLSAETISDQKCDEFRLLAALCKTGVWTEILHKPGRWGFASPTSHETREADRLANSISKKSLMSMSAISGRNSPWYRAIELIYSDRFKEICEMAGERYSDFMMPELSPLGSSNYLVVGPEPEPRSDCDSLLASLLPDVAKAREQDIADKKRLHKLDRLKSVARKLAANAARALVEGQFAFSGWNLSAVPTTLDAIDVDDACRLVRRGYANTAITLYMLGLIDALPGPKQLHPWLYEREECDGAI